MRVDLQGQVALVTGAARGIGRAIADRLAAEGASVVYTDIIAPADNARDARHYAMALDVTNEAQIGEVVAAVLQRYGKLDIAVNNAGIGTGPDERADIDQVTTAQWDRVLKVDLTGVFLVSRAVAAPMIRQKSGRIINISSRSMALELAKHNILVNAIAPGSTETDSWREWINDANSEQQALYTRLLSHIPLGRPAKTSEIAHAALFLAAPDSSYITGHVLTVDGGWIAGYSRDF